MLNSDALEDGMAAAINAAREHLDVGTDGEAVDQVVVLVTFLLPSGSTIACGSPVVKADPHLAHLATSVCGDAGGAL